MFRKRGPVERDHRWCDGSACKIQRGVECIEHGRRHAALRGSKRLIKSKPTLEGAGVHLRRAFGFGDTSQFDPFLLLDDFRNDVPNDYLAGFPWHPHRGIETITYVQGWNR